MNLCMCRDCGYVFKYVITYAGCVGALCQESVNARCVVVRVCI